MVTDVSEEPAVSIFKIGFVRVEIWSCYRRKVKGSSWGEQEDQPEWRGDRVLFSLSSWLNRAQSLPHGLTDPSSCKYHQAAFYVNSNFYHVIGKSDVTFLYIALTNFCKCERCLAVIWYKGNLPEKILGACRVGNSFKKVGRCLGISWKSWGKIKIYYKWNYYNAD